MLMAADIAYPELVQAWYKTISEIIFEFDGSLNKFIGDGTMAIFCIPNKDPEGKQDAINAVSASLKAREGFERVRREWNEKWSKEFSRALILDYDAGLILVTSSMVILERLGMINLQRWVLKFI